MSLESRVEKLKQRVSGFIQSARGLQIDLLENQRVLETLQRFHNDLEAIEELVADEAGIALASAEYDRVETEFRALTLPPIVKRVPGQFKVVKPSLATDWLEKKPGWRFSKIDFDYPQRWLEHGSADTLRDLIQRLQGFECLTWKEIEFESKHNHEWDSVDDWEESAQERLRELKIDDEKRWYQLQLTQLGRLFGYRSDGVFHVVWWDRDHVVYKTKSNRRNH